MPQDLNEEKDMELVWLVYLVSVLTQVDCALGGLVGVLAIVAVVGGFFTMIHCSDNGRDWSEWRSICYKYLLWPKILAFALVTAWLIPDEKTIKYMAAAYLIQTTYESEFVQEAGSLAGKAVTNQLRKWAESNPDIDSLIQSMDETKQSVETLSK
jgi:hypothetical protein